MTIIHDDGDYADYDDSHIMIMIMVTMMFMVMVTMMMLTRRIMMIKSMMVMMIVMMMTMHYPGCCQDAPARLVLPL